MFILVKFLTKGRILMMKWCIRTKVQIRSNTKNINKITFVPSLTINRPSISFPQNHNQQPLKNVLEYII